MENMNTCRVCGAALAEGASFCAECGAEQSGDREPEAAYCPSCGGKLKSGADFCVQCGSPASAAAGAPRQGTYTQAPEAPLWKDPPAAYGPPPEAEKPKNDKNKTILIVLASLLSVCLIAVVILLLMDPGKEAANVPPQAASPEALPKQDAVPSQTPSQAPSPLSGLSEDEMQDIIDSYGIDAAVAVISPDTWDSVYTEAATEVMPASALINIPILYAASVLADEGTVGLDTLFPFSYTLSGRGSIPQALDGDRLSLIYLLGSMLMYSDNNATNSLISAFGFDGIEDACGVFRSVDMTTYIGTNDNNYVSAMEVMYMLSELWCSDGEISRDFLTSYMYISDEYQYLGLGEAVPDYWAFMNHNALKNGIYNEAAIVVTTGGNAYIIVFMGESAVSYTDTAALAAELGDYIFARIS